MKILKYGSTGQFVERWQHFLLGSGYKLEAHGKFDAATKIATRKYQRSEKLKSDGIVGNMTLAAAMADGFELMETTIPVSQAGTGSQAWPAKPKGLRPPNAARRKRMFGDFDFKAAPTSRNPEKIIIDPDWVRANIIRVHTPALKSVLGNRGIRLHRKVKPHFDALIDELEDKELLDLILTWNGSYYPRYVRGSRRTLSNHSYGSAFDVNVQWNRLGRIPALVGDTGSVRELVPIANKHGFYWGGHYRTRKDGMHFEFAGRL